MKKSIKKSIKISLIVLLSLFAVVFANGCYYVFYGQEKSVVKLQQGKELNLYECCSIYTMHMAVWMFGWPLAPEAAHECFRLHFPQKDTVEIFDTPKGFRNSKIEKAAYKLEDRPFGTTIDVTWNGNKDYALSSPEHRSAIALNPCKVIRSNGFGFVNPWYFDIEVVSPMIYPKYSRTTFNLGWFKVVLNEGLFRYLQDRGWLCKYTIVYHELFDRTHPSKYGN